MAFVVSFPLVGRVYLKTSIAVLHFGAVQVPSARTIYADMFTEAPVAK